MISLDQFKYGLVKYIDNDILPHLSGIQQLAVSTYAALAMLNLENTIIQNKDKLAINMLGVIDENGQIDIEKIYSSMRPQFDNGQKYSVTFPLMGEVMFSQSDLEKLYRYMTE